MKDRLSILDSLKGIAVIGIFCIHIGVNNNIFSSRFEHFFSYGNRGVEITYIVSAFLLARQYYNNCVRDRYPLKVVIKNIANIIPIYYMSIIGAELLNLLVHRCSLPMKTIVANLLFLSVFSSAESNIGGSLYFSCLLFTWIIYMVYVRYVDSLKKSVCVTLVVVLISMYGIPGGGSILLGENGYANIFYLCRCICSFAVGHMLYLIVDRESFKNVIISPVIQIFAISFLMCIVYLDGMKDRTFTFVIILALFLINYDENSILSNSRCLKYLGKRVLPIYCWHILIGELLKAYMELNLFYFIVVICLTVVLSEITYRVDMKRRKKMSVILNEL